MRAAATSPAARIGGRHQERHPASATPIWVWAGLIVLLTLAAYLPAIRGGFIWDDPEHVTGNRLLRSTAGLGRIWGDIGATPQFYPVVFTAFWVQYRLWGADPLGYHLLNVALHALSAVLLGTILKRLRIPGAWLAAAVFALHPVHVESVAWITELKNVLSGFLYLLAMLAYLRYAGLTEGTSRRSAYVVALVLFLAALLSKTVTCSLPAAVLLLIWYRRGRLRRADVLPTLPLFAAGVLAAGITAWVERHYVGTRYVDLGLSGVERVLVAGRAVGFYLGKLVWPGNLTFSYPRWQIDARDPWQILNPLLVAAVIGLLFLGRRRLGRGPLVAALFFVGTLVPALGFVDVYPLRFSFVADHFQYLASIGPITLFAALAARALGAVGGSKVRSGAVARQVPLLAAWRAAPVGVLLGVLAVLTWRQGRDYRDEPTLWRATLQRNPDSWMAMNNLAMLLPSGQEHEKLALLERAIRTNPEFADAHNNLGVHYLERGEIERARHHFSEALRSEPHYAQAHCNLANLLHREGRTDEAIARYRYGLSIKPDYATGHANLGGCLAARGETAEAYKHLLTAVLLEPELALAHYNLATFLVSTGRLDEALAHFEQALRLGPDDAGAHTNLAGVLLMKSRAAEALGHLKEAARLQPDNAQTRYNLGVVLFEQGRPQEAAEHLAAAVRLQPDSAEAHHALAGVLVRLGRADEAIEHDRQAIRLRAEFVPAYENLARTLLSLGRPTEALEVYGALLTVQPRHAEARAVVSAASSAPATQRAPGGD